MMKRRYEKPSLRMEIFEINDIIAASPDILLEENIEVEGFGTINFSEGNTLQCINYKEFWK